MNLRAWSSTLISKRTFYRASPLPCPEPRRLTSGPLWALERRSGEGFSTGRFRLRESKKQGQTRRN